MLLLGIVMNTLWIDKPNTKITKRCSSRMVVGILCWEACFGRHCHRSASNSKLCDAQIRYTLSPNSQLTFKFCIFWISQFWNLRSAPISFHPCVEEYFSIHLAKWVCWWMMSFPEDRIHRSSNSTFVLFVYEYINKDSTSRLLAYSVPSNTVAQCFALYDIK
jgi:hypothetical protein